MTTSDILVVIPTYNEKENITLIIPEIKKALPNCHILVVDDNSPDGTSASVKELAKSIDGIFVLDRTKKEGLGRAYVAGFTWALERSYKYIFEIDADFSHDPKYLPNFMKAIESHDLVIGSRYISGVNVVNWPMSRLLLSYYSNKLMRFLIGLPVRDGTAGFKCFRREILEKIRLDRIASSGYSFQFEMNFLAWKLGYRIHEIPIVFTERQRGVSKMSSSIIREALFLLWRLRMVDVKTRVRQ